MMEERTGKETKRSNLIIILPVVVLIAVLIILHLLSQKEKENSSTDYNEFSEYSNNYVETFIPGTSDVNKDIKFYWFESVSQEDMDYIAEVVTQQNQKVEELYYISFDDTTHTYTVEDEKDNVYEITLTN